MALLLVLSGSNHKTNSAILFFQEYFFIGMGVQNNKHAPISITIELDDVIA